MTDRAAIAAIDALNWDAPPVTEAVEWVKAWNIKAVAMKWPTSKWYWTFHHGSFKKIGRWSYTPPDEELEDKL